jgi:hypothetical protein
MEKLASSQINPEFPQGHPWNSIGKFLPQKEQYYMSVTGKPMLPEQNSYGSQKPCSSIREAYRGGLGTFGPHV